MRGRIESQIEQRTMMLSGVSHDLRTPLTRMRLGLSMLDETPEVKDIERDVAEMEGLLDTFLDFARGEALDDPAEADPVQLARGGGGRSARRRRDRLFRARHGGAGAHAAQGDPAGADEPRFERAALRQQRDPVGAHAGPGAEVLGGG
jgi:signal transduction histidine kinase